MASISDRYINDFKLQINSHCPAKVLKSKDCSRNWFSRGECLVFLEKIENNENQPSTECAGDDFAATWNSLHGLFCYGSGWLFFY